MEINVPSSQSLDTDEVMPLDPFLTKLRQRKDLKRTGIDVEFPVFQNADVKHTLGSKGRPFGLSIYKELYWDEAEQKVVGAVWFSYACEGPFGSVHGGAAATALDSVLGFCCLRSQGFGCYTLNLNVNYRKFIPLGSVVKLEAKVTKVDGKKIYCSGKLSNTQDDSLHVEADALFYQPEKQLTYEQMFTLIGANSSVSPEQLIEQIKKQRSKQKKPASTAAEQRPAAKL